MLKHYRWLPRILAITFTAFIFIFSLDSTSGLGFLIHNITTFILALLTLIAWKKKNIGGFLFILFSFLMFFYLSKPLSISPFIIGVMFITVPNKI